MVRLQWARLRADVNCQLRRGAWYRVLRLAPTEAVVDVSRTPLSVPRSLLELTDAPPRRWSVVPHPRDAVGLPVSWGDYAVCPNCRDRAPLMGRPSTIRCPGCNGLFEVAWDEQYLASG